MSSVAESGWELKELQKLEGHTDRVWSVAWKPGTGTHRVPAVLASCSGDKTVRIWEKNLATGLFECKAVLDRHTRTVRSCAWNAYKNFFATGSFDATSAIWEKGDDGYNCVSTLEGHENEVKCVAWTNTTGDLLATCGRDKTVWIWEVSSDNEFEVVSVLPGHTQDVKSVQWHPTMDILFSCSYDNTIKIWWDEVVGEDEWSCYQTISQTDNGHSSTIWALSFNLRGDRMVTCSDDRTLKIWSANIERQENGDGFAPWGHIYTLSGYHDGTIFSVHWSSDGIIATGAADDSICLFAEDEDGLSDEPKYRLILKKNKAHDMDVNCVQWKSGDDDDDKQLLASASDDGTIKIWELTSVSGSATVTS